MKQKRSAKTKTLVAVDKYVSVTSIQGQMLVNVHEIVCESKIMYGTELWDRVRHGKN
jgi:hypothetical protein